MTGEETQAFLYLNGDHLEETTYVYFTRNGEVRSSGGRAVTLEAKAGDNISLRTEYMTGTLYKIYFCAEFTKK